MKQDQERWLDEKLDRDLEAWADEQERLLMEDEELQDIHMPAGSLEKIHQRLEERSRSVEEAEGNPPKDDGDSRKSEKSSGRVRVKMLLVLAAALVLVVGAGVVSSGKKLFSPDIQQRERGDEVHVKVNNAEIPESQYDEEEVCQEIQEELGVYSIRFEYQPKGMYLKEYLIDENNIAVMLYECNGKNVDVIIGKDYSKSTIDWQTDGDIIGSLEPISISSCGIETIIHIYQDSEGESYYSTNFEYLDTYYGINGTLKEEEFIKLIENIVIKNV